MQPNIKMHSLIAALLLAYCLVLQHVHGFLKFSIYRTKNYLLHRIKSSYTTSLSAIADPNDSINGDKDSTKKPPGSRKNSGTRKKMKQQNSDSDVIMSKKSVDMLLDYNWRYGMCQHFVTFEGAQTIRRFKFVHDLMAFSFIDGRVCLINITTSDILNKYNEHNNVEVTGLDFDGVHLCSGGADGCLCMYMLTFDESKSFGNATFKLPNLHNNAITGLKLVTAPVKPASSSSSSKQSGSPSNSSNLYVISCALDRKLICTNFYTGDKVYEVQLPGIPLCMDVKDGYIVVGLNDGRVIFYKAATGTQLMHFHSKHAKVRSIFMDSSSILFTGSDDGKITRWDLSGGADTGSAAATAVTAALETKSKSGDKGGSSDSESIKDKPLLPLPTLEESILNTLSRRPTRLIDYYFLEAAAVADQQHRPPPGEQQSSSSSSSDSNKVKKSPRSTRDISSSSSTSSPPPITYSDEECTSAVVSLQADRDKVLAAYADGVVRAWDALTARSMFDLKGRNRLISTLQFDESRLVADGTYSAVVMHDFSQSPSALNASSDELTLVLNNYDGHSGTGSSSSNFTSK